MNTTCNTGTDIPNLDEEVCKGVYYATNCVIHPTTLTYLNLPVNSSVFTIINSFILALTYKDEQIQILTDALAALDARVVALEP